MSRGLTVRFGLAAVAAAVPAAVCAVFFTGGGGLALFLVLVASAAATSLANVALMSFGITAGLAATVGVIAQLPDPYYRPEIRYARGDGFVPNISVEHTLQFGDLVATSGTRFAAVAEPRQITFATDSRGWRNSTEYAEGDIVLIGDSFVAGYSSDQSDMIGERIRKKTGRGVYSIGYHGGLDDYLYRLKQFGRPAWLFVFEGNDLWDKNLCYDPAERIPKNPGVLKRIQNALALPAKTRSYWQRAFHAIKTAGRNVVARARGRVPQTPVVSRTVGGYPMLFLSEHTRILGAANYAFPPCLVEKFIPVAGLVQGVVFIPTKYRIYHGLLDHADPVVPTEVGWHAIKALAGAAGVPAFDLTPALAAAAQNAIKEGKFVYWRDDTHWNDLGADAAAREFARVALGIN